jgi:hypothetical protein
VTNPEIIKIEKHNDPRSILVAGEFRDVDLSLTKRLCQIMRRETSSPKFNYSIANINNSKGHRFVLNGGV